MNLNAAPSQKQSTATSTIITEALMGGFAGWLLALFLSILILWIAAMIYGGQWLAGAWMIGALKARFLTMVSGFPLIGKQIHANGGLSALMAWWAVLMGIKYFFWIEKISFFLPILAGGAWGGWRAFNRGAGIGEIHISGLKFFSDPIAGARQLSQSCEAAIKQNKRGVCLFHGNQKLKPVYISEQSESAHFMFAGRSGSGKTQAMQHLLNSALARGDKLFVYDFKSDDFTRWFANDCKQKTACLIAPWDTRTWVWDIARDVRKQTDSSLIAKSLLPSKSGGGDDYFSQAARSILNATIKYLHGTFKNDWGFAELAALFSDLDLLRSAVSEISPGVANAHLGDGDSMSDQTQGVIGSLQEAGEWLEQMAVLWPRCARTQNRMFSIQDFVRCEGVSGALQTVVIGANEEFVFFHPVVASMISLYIGIKTALPAGTGGRQWCILDELGTLPKLENLTIGMTNARSKGLRIVIGIQDLGALRERYGENLTQTIANQCGTQVVGSARDPVSMKFYSDLFGTQVVERINKTIQPASAGGSPALIDLIAGSGGGAASMGWQREERATVHTGIIESLPPLNMLILTPDAPDLVVKVKYEYSPLPSTGAAIVMRQIISAKRWPSVWDIIKNKNKTESGGGGSPAPKIEKNKKTNADILILVDEKIKEAEQKNADVFDLKTAEKSPETKQKTQENEGEGVEKEVLSDAAECVLNAHGVGLLSDLIAASEVKGDFGSHQNAEQKTKKKTVRRMMQ